MNSGWFGRKRRCQELNDELSSHLDMATEDRVQEVLSDRPEGFVEACLDRGLSLIPFFPLAAPATAG